MAGGGPVDWSAAIKPIIAASPGSFSKNDIPDLVKTILKSKQDILKHDGHYESFHSPFAALSAHYLSTCAAYVSKNQLTNVSQACKVLLEFFLQKLQNFNEQCCLSQKELMLLIKGLCKGVGFLQRAEVTALTTMLKSAKLPPTETPSSVDKQSDESRDSKRSRQDPCNAILEQLITPLHESTEKCKLDGSSEAVDREADAFIVQVPSSSLDIKNLFASKNVANLQQLNAGDILITMCLSLPHLRQYVTCCTDALNSKGFVLPSTNSDASAVRNSFHSLLNDINIVWRALSLPILEPLHDDRLSKLTTVVSSCLFLAVTAAMANSIVSMSSSSSSKTSVSKDDDLDNCAIGIVEKCLEIFNYVSTAIHNSTRAGGHNLQNFQLIAAWILLMGLQHILCMVPPHSGLERSKDGQSKSQSSKFEAKTPEHQQSKQPKDQGSSSGASVVGRQSLIKVQQGFGVLSVGLASQALHLLVSLLEDVQVEAAILSSTVDTKSSDGCNFAFDVQGRCTAWQRVQKLLSSFNLTNLLFNLAAISYRKACMLRRIQKHLPDGETFSTSDSSSCCPDDISWSDDTSGDEDEDSEPILGQWFEETLTPKEPPTEAKASLATQPNADTASADSKLTPSGGLDHRNLVPEKGEPHGFINLASSIFAFMNRHFLNTDCLLMRNYAAKSLNEQHMIILAGIIKDLDRETSRNELGDSCFGTSVLKLYEEFSLAIAKYSHNLLATASLSDSLQNLLLAQLGVCPYQEEDWPLQVYPRTLAIVAQVFLLRQQKEKDELKSESDAACGYIWQRFLQTLKKRILNPPISPSVAVIVGSSVTSGAVNSAPDELADLNVEHAQLLLFLFHSLQLMQKKIILLDCAQTIVTVSDVIHTCMSENQILFLARLLLIFEYLMKNLYEAPNSLIEQIQTNLFSLHSPPLSNDSDKDGSKPNKLFFMCKDIEENFCKNCDSDGSQVGVKPRFYNLVNVDVVNQDVPKLDGFSSNFLLGTPDILLYSKFYSALLTILGVGRQCDLLSRYIEKNTFYLGRCATQYCFTIAWRLLLSLPPSAVFLQSLSSSTPVAWLQCLPLSLIWIPRTSQKGFASWIKDCLVKQGLTTQKAEALLRVLTKTCNSVSYDVEQTKLVINSLLSKYPQAEVGTIIPREALPSLFQVCLLDCVIAKLHVAVDEAFSKPASDIDPRSKEIAGDILPGILQLIELYTVFIRSNLLYQMNDASDPPGFYSQKALIAHGLTVSLSSSRCSKASAIAMPFMLYMPLPLRTVLDRWNGSCLSEFPAISAWRNAFANDPIPSESYICAIQTCHLATLSSKPNFNTSLALKHTLDALVRFVGNLVIPCQDDSSSATLGDSLFPLILDASTENLADFISLTLEKIIGACDSDEYLERVFYRVLTVGNLLLTNHPDKESGLDERIYHDLLKFIESMLEKAPGRKALANFYSKDKDFSIILLSASNEHLSVSYGTKVLKLFTKLFQLAEKSQGDRSLEILCCSIEKLAKISCTELQEWLEKIIGKQPVPSEDSNAVLENRQLMQTLASCIVRENSNVSEDLASAILHALTPMATQILMTSVDSEGFPELMVVMATLAGAGVGSGHIPFLKSASFWLCLSKNYLSQKEVTEKLESGAVIGKHQIMIESVCCVLSYLVDVLSALRYSKDKHLSNLRNGMASPPLDGDFPHLDVDSDWADDLGQEEEDSAGEDSDEDSLSNKLCTFTFTQKEFMNQHWYHCHTCKMVDGVGVCSICAKVCHKDHDVTYAKYGSFFCDCGAKEDNSCQALVKRAAIPAAESNALPSSGPSAFSSASALPSSLRRRSSSPIANDRNDSKKVSAVDEGIKRRQALSKQLEPLRENVFSCISLPKIANAVLEMLLNLKPAIVTNCYQNSPVGSSTRIQQALKELHKIDKMFETTDQLMVPTLGSQEGAFENVRMNYSGDQGQTIRQLIGAHMIRRVAMCVLASWQGKRQHLAVSHEKGKITILQLSSLLKQADSSKRKLTLTRLASAPVPFTVLSIAGNPCNEEFLAVCGLKDCHVLTFSPSGSISDHLALQPQPAIGNFIIKAIWLPGSQTELALIMPDFVKIYDLAVDAVQPQFHFLLPSGKIRDCCFAFTEDGCHHLLLMSSAGHIYTQPMCEESSAKHGPFYVTNILEVKHSDIKDANGQIGGGGVSIYYSHSLQLLFFSYAQGKSFISPLPKMTSELNQLYVINFKTNGGSKTNNQPLCQWSEVGNHPGLVCCLTQTNNNPVVLMIKPDAILIQEIKVMPSKSKITDMVAIRHVASSGDQRTTLILLCEDGSLRIYMANVEQTGFWLMPPHQTLSTAATTRPPKKKKAAKPGRPAGSVAFPVDFFEHCVPLSEVEFGGNDVLQIYNTQQVKHRLNTHGMYIASTKPAGFTIEVTNPDASMVITGVRIQVGSQDIQRAPAYIEIFGRTVQVTLTRSRWYDFPLTREESLQADKKMSLFFGASSFPSGVTMVDSIKIYGKSKDTFGWPEDTDEFATCSPTALPSTTVQANDSERIVAVPLPLNSMDRLLAGSLELLDSCFSVMSTSENKHPLRSVVLDLATHLLILPTPQSVQQQTKSLLVTLLANRVSYHNHKDQALLSDVAQCLTDIRESVSNKQLDVESFYNLVITARAVAVSRPHNLVRFAESLEETLTASNDSCGLLSEKKEQELEPLTSRLAILDASERRTFLGQMMDAFWKLHDAQPQNPALAPVSQPGLSHLDAVVQAIVEIIPAFATTDLDNLNIASKLYVQLLLCENPAVSFVCKQALTRVLRPRYRRRVCIPSPPRCSTPVTGGTLESGEDIKLTLPLNAGSASTSQEHSELERVQEERSAMVLSPESAAAMLTSGPLGALLAGQVNFPQMLDMPPDAVDETMMELAIALSLQDQSGPAPDLDLQAFSLGAQACHSSPLERAQFSDTTASVGGSDDEGSTAATDGSTLRTPPAEQGGSAGSESGGSGVDSITGEHNASGRSSANEDNVPESTTTGARSETSSVGMPSTSLHPDVDGCEVEAETEFDGDATIRLHNLRLLLLEKFLQHVPRLRQISGIRAIPFLQVILLLTTDLDGENEKDRAALDNLLNVMIGELEMESKEAAAMAERTPRHEVQLIIMRLLSVMISRAKTSSKGSAQNDCSTFISNVTANALINNGAIRYCLHILKSLLEYWRQYQAEDASGSCVLSCPGVLVGPPKGSLLKPHPTFPLPNMIPFFMRPYVKGHANDVFEAYPQLLTEMVLRLPYQIKKISDNANSSTSVSSATTSPLVPVAVFEQAWFYYLCEYLMTQQTPYVRKQVRKLLLFICGSKDRYRQLRDLYVLESNLKEAKVLCAQGGYSFQGANGHQSTVAKQPSSRAGNSTIVLPYDMLITLIEHLKACVEIATSRTINWQHFCEKDESVLPFLVQVSYLLDEGVSPIILQLLQCALSSSSTTLVQSSNVHVQSVSKQSKESDRNLQQNQEGVSEESVSTTEAQTQCAILVQQVNKYVDRNVLSCFIKAFLLESNQSAVRWQAHSLVLSLFTHSSSTQQEAVLDLMWKLWPQLPSYVRKAAQFVDLLGYFAIRIPPNVHKAHEYVDKAYTLLNQQNRILTYHPNAALYTAFQGLVEFDGYYLESEPCLVCNDPEVPLTSLKLSALKMDSCFTTTTQIIKLIGSHVISKIVLRIGDLKRSKMLRTVIIYYNNRSVQAVVELKNKPAMWHKARRCVIAAGQTELKVEFPLPIVACNLMIEYADFYENVQASSETLQCPRCSASVPANPGVCANCGENVFQCHKCRAINYDEKDPFLCNTCGFCKYAKFDYTLTAKPCCAVDPIENEDDRKKAVAFINTLLEKADRVYRQLVSNKPVLEALLTRINEHSFEGPGEDAGGGTSTTGTSGGTSAASASSGVAGVNKAIQQLAQRYCGDCKSAFDELGKIIQKVLATRKELVEYDRQQRESGSRPAGPTTPISRESLLRSLSGPSTEEPQSLSSGRCYGCASAATEHCITLLRALATNARTRQIQCDHGLIRELVDYNLRQGSTQVCSEVRQLLCLLTRDNPRGTEELNSIILEKISLAYRSQMNSSEFAASVHHEMALLAASVQRYDSCWEQRLRCVMNIFLLGVNSKSPVVMETITLPCLCILQSLIKPVPPSSKKNKDKTVDLLTTVKVEGTDVRIDLRKWLAGDALHSFNRWKSRVPSSTASVPSQVETNKKIKEETREHFLAEKYGAKWRHKCRKDVIPIKLVDSEWLRHILFDPPSHAARQEACNMIESLCTIPTRKKEILDLLTSFLDDLGKSGESASEFLNLYQNLIKAPQWKSYLAIRGVLPHIGNLITKEISHLTWLEETTLKSDLCEGYALKMLTELLASFIEQSNIRRHYKSRLVGVVLNGYLSLRKLVIQRTKQVDATQAKLLELLEEMTTGNESETQAFMTVCVETVKKYPLDDYRTPVFIFERLCSIIYPEENDMGEFFVTLDKDPQQEDFLQGRMLGNPYSSNEPGIGPLMRDIKNKICQDCELVALLEDDNGMELLVNNKIISLDLPVKEVYKKVWLPENGEGESMRIVYRMRGLLGDATEEFVESLDARSNEEVDNEEVYRMANWMSHCGGFIAMLERLGSVHDLTRGRSLLTVLLKLFGFCTKVKANRQALIQPEMKTLIAMLGILHLALNADNEQVQGQPGCSSITEQLLQIMETILVEASSLCMEKYTIFTETCGTTEDIQFLLDKLSSHAVRNHSPILQLMMRVIPFLAFASLPKLSLLVEFFKPCSDFNSFDFERKSNDELKMECLCRMANSIERNALGAQLKDMIIEAGIVHNALAYIQQHAPPIRSALLLDSDELKEFISKPSLKYILRLLTGLSHGHEATQCLVSTNCIPIIHRLEQVSSDEHVGSLAENLMEALRENLNVAQKIEEVRKLTRAEKKRLAMAMREKQLAGLGMSTNEKGQVTAKSQMFQQIEELGEETGLVCCICREGYRFQPTKVLGIYTYTKRCNADDFENKPRKTPAYSTVTHFNVVHVDCHMSAVRLARGRDEWESAALQNANTRCNGLLPLWGPQVPESAFASCLARHNTYLQECTGHRDIGYPSTFHDLKLLLMRFAKEKSFSEDSGGGGPQSNLHLIPYLMHMALYVINTTRSATKEDRNLNSYLDLGPDKWVENSFEAEGPLYWTALSLCVHPYVKWRKIRVKHLQKLLVMAHVREVAPQGTLKITDKEVKDYNVYKSVLIFFGVVDGLYSYLFQKLTCSNEADWPMVLAEDIRNNDQRLLEAGDKLLAHYQDQLLPCQSFVELCDIVNILEDIPNPDEFLASTLSKLPS